MSVFSLNPTWKRKRCMLNNFHLFTDWVFCSKCSYLYMYVYCLNVSEALILNNLFLFVLFFGGGWGGRGKSTDGVVVNVYASYSAAVGVKDRFPLKALYIYIYIVKFVMMPAEPEILHTYCFNVLRCLFFVLNNFFSRFLCITRIIKLNNYR